MEPRIDRIDPPAALPGGDVRLAGQYLRPPGQLLPEVHFGEVAGTVILSSASALLVRVPEGALSAGVRVAWEGDGPGMSAPAAFNVAVPIAENLHPVCNPALDAEGNILVTFSGARGQKSPVTLYKVDTNYTLKPFSSTITNPSGLAFDAAGTLYVSSRHDGTVYRVAPNGTAAAFAEGLGLATGLAFDLDGNLYVGDRSGTVFKLDRQGKTFVFATLEPSVAAYHLAFGPDQNLYVTGPTTSSFDVVWRISPAGEVSAFYRGLGRPQGLAFDREGRLYVAASHRGRRGIVRIEADGRGAELVVAGSGLVGLSFARGPALILATTSALYHLEWDSAGWPLLGA